MRELAHTHVCAYKYVYIYIYLRRQALGYMAHIWLTHACKAYSCAGDPTLSLHSTMWEYLWSACARALTAMRQDQTRGALSYAPCVGGGRAQERAHIACYWILGQLSSMTSAALFEHTWYWMEAVVRHIVCPVSACESVCCRNFLCCCEILRARSTD